MKMHSRKLAGIALSFLLTLSATHAIAEVYREPADRVFRNVHAGWPAVFKAAEAKLSPQRSYILMTVIEPSIAMDLRSAELFRRSYDTPGMTDSFAKPMLGHNMVAWQCIQPNGQVVRGATGMTGEDGAQSRQMVKAGWGLTALMSSFTDGYLQSSRTVGRTLERRMPNERTWSVVVEVEHPQCDNMLSFLEAYIFEPSRPMDNFGLGVRPENFEGAGCGSLAATLISESGIFPHEVTEAYNRVMSAPLHLFGRSLPVPENTRVFQLQNQVAPDPYKVSLLRFIDGPWAGNGPQESMPITDPEMILFTLRSLNELYLDDLKSREASGGVPKGKYETVANQYFSRFPNNRIIKSRTPWNEATPEESMGPSGQPWLTRYIPINADFDANAKAVRTGIESWWNSKLQLGYQSHMIFDGHMNYLMIEKSPTASTLQ